MTVSFMLPQQVQATGIQYLAGFFEVFAALAVLVKTPRAHRSRLRSVVSGEMNSARCRLIPTRTRSGS